MKLKKVLFVLMFGLIALLLVACGGKTVESIEVEGLAFPQLIVVNQDVPLDKNAVKIIVTYDNGDVETVKLDDVELSGAIAIDKSGAIAIDKLDTAEKGKKTISISYKGTSIDVDFMVYGALPAAVPAVAGKMDEAGTLEYPYLIETVGNLVWLADQVNNHGQTYAGKHFQLQNDIDMEALMWTPIGATQQKINKAASDVGSILSTFSGIFDGNNKTIKNLMVNNQGNVESIDSTAPYYGGTIAEPVFGPQQAQGFFGHVTAATIKNLTFDNAYVVGLESVSVVVAGSTDKRVKNAQGETIITPTTIDNVTVKNSVIVAAHWAGGLVGYSAAALTVLNSSVLNTSIGAYIYGKDPNADKVGGLVGYYDPKVPNINHVNRVQGNIVKDVELVGFRDLGGAFGYVDGDNEILQNNVENVIIRLDKAQLTNPNHIDGEKKDYRYVGAIIGRRVSAVDSTNKFTNVKTYIRLEGAAQYIEYVTMSFGKKTQVDYTAK